MNFNLLGNSNIKVSEICLGGMNWGTQNSEAEVQGQTEEIIGS
jgi:aryl-alcohol dehydrogenase-like predicted oxidoreductase